MVVSIDETMRRLHRLYRDSYWAVGGFETGDYLVKAYFEHQDKFEYRKAVSLYSNFYQTSVDANLLPIFEATKRIYAEEDSHPMYDLLIEDVDGLGTDFDSFMKESSIEADVYGSIILLPDRDPVENSSKADDLAGNDLPYILRFNPLDLVEYELLGGKRVVYFVWPDYNENGEQIYNAYYYGKIYSNIEPVGLNGKFSPKIEGIETFGTAQLLTTNTSYSPFFLPSPKYSAIAKAGKSHFQIVSLTQYQSVTSTISVMDYPGDLGDDKIKMDQQTIIETDPESTRGIEFKTPENTMERLRDEADAIKVDIFTQANLSILFTDSSASGEAKKMSDGIRVSLLKGKSKKIARIDNKIMGEMLAGIGLDPKKYVASYPNDFESMTLSQTILDNAEILNMNPAAQNRVKIMINTFDAKFPNATDAERQAYISAEVSNIDNEVPKSGNEDTETGDE